MKAKRIKKSDPQRLDTLRRATRADLNRILDRDAADAMPPTRADVLVRRRQKHPDLSPEYRAEIERRIKEIDAGHEGVDAFEALKGM